MIRAEATIIVQLLFALLLFGCVSTADGIQSATKEYGVFFSTDRAVWTDADIESANYFGPAEQGGPALQIELSPSATQTMENFTTRNVGKLMMTVVTNEVISDQTIIRSPS